MSVLIINHVSDLGGAERSMEALILNLRPKGFIYKVVLPGSGAFTSRLRKLGVNVEIIPLESWRWWVDTPMSVFQFWITLPLQFVSVVRWVFFLKSAKV